MARPCDEPSRLRPAVAIALGLTIGAAMVAACGPGPADRPARVAASPQTVAPPAAAPPAEIQRVAARAPTCPAEMVLLSGGEYERKRWRDSQDLAKVEVAAFCMDVTEVTVSAYRGCVAAGTCKPPHDQEWIGFQGLQPTRSPHCNGLRDDRGDHPVNCVSGLQAKAFCDWRGGRLPTLDEWHWAARSGGEGRRYPWGDIRLLRQACSSRMVNRDLPAGGTCDVGAHPLGRSAQGIEDLAGNVNEWTATESRRSRWDNVLLAFVGGGYNMRNEGLLVMHQYLSEVGYMPYVGFRCVKPLGPAKRVEPRTTTAATCPGNVDACKLGCEHGNLASCSHLGEHLQAGQSIDRDRDRAAALYRRACDGGHPKGCTRLAFLHDRGIAVKKDFKRAGELYVKACQGGDPEGCIGVGVYFDLGQARKRDSARAAGFFRRACDLGSANGCRRQGVRERNAAKRQALLEKSCKGKDGIGCDRLGDMHLGGHGVAADAKQAAAWYRKGCELGYSPSCTAHGELMIRGAGVPQNEAAGIELIRQACKAGHAHGCTRLKQLTTKP